MDFIMEMKITEVEKIDMCEVGFATMVIEDTMREVNTIKDIL